MEVKERKAPGISFKMGVLWMIPAVVISGAGATSIYPAARANKVNASQEKEAARPTAGDQSTSLNDQTDLNVTVYNSNIALVRDVRQLTLPSGTIRLKFIDIAATVHPATVHF